MNINTKLYIHEENCHVYIEIVKNFKKKTSEDLSDIKF